METINLQVCQFFVSLQGFMPKVENKSRTEPPEYRALSRSKTQIRGLRINTL
jgi:hypothetical protein